MICFSFAAGRRANLNAYLFSVIHTCTYQSHGILFFPYLPIFISGFSYRELDNPYHQSQLGMAWLSRLPTHVLESAG